MFRKQSVKQESPAKSDKCMSYYTESASKK